MSLISRGFGALNKIITRGFFQREFIRPEGYLKASVSVYPVLSAQVDIKPALTAQISVRGALEAQINVIN